MNLNNYGTRPACQQLLDAGIVLKTELCWLIWDGEEEEASLRDTDNIPISQNRAVFGQGFKVIPAPSTDEAWDALPDEWYQTAADPVRYKIRTPYIVGYHSGGQGAGMMMPYIKENLPDVLICLLIWVVEQRKD